MEKMFRNVFLSLSQNNLCKKIALNHGHRFGANRFVAGATLDEALTVIQQLHNEGLAVTVDHLGEFVTDKNEAEAKANHCVEVIQRLANENVDAHVSVKLTSLGLDIGRDIAVANVRKIVDAAKTAGIFITIDMEEFSRCQAILDIFTEVRQEHDNIGTVLLQAYLYRTDQDLAALAKINATLRLCKGAYKESPSVAFSAKSDVDYNFKKMIRKYLLSGCYTAIATHDELIISYAKQLIAKKEIRPEQFEFQMLYGIRPDLQKKLVEEGYKVRVYVPYGQDWYGYFMRRLAERPANVAFVTKNLFRK